MDTEYLSILAENPEFYLEEEDLPQVQESKKQINVSKTNSITLFGTDIQSKMADLSQMMLQNLGEADVDEINSVIEQTVGYLNTLEEVEEDKKILFWKRKAKGLSIQSRYDQVAQNVEMVQQILEKHQVRLLKDCAMLDQIYAMNQEYFKQLNIRIAAAKDKVSDIKLGVESVDSERKFEVIDRLERKIEELEVSRTISLQQAPQIRMLQMNSATMADKLQSTVYTVIPLWKNQIVLALGAEHTRQAINADKQLTDMTNHLLVKNAENLKMVSIETQKARNENTIDVKALEKTNQILLDSLDEITRIQEEGRIKRSTAELELVRIDEEMKTGLAVMANKNL